MKKMIWSLLLVLGMVILSPINGQASETEEATFDLSTNERQEISLLNDQGEEVVFTLEPVSPLSRIANGTYKVSASFTSWWNAHFYVTISSNDISKVDRPSCQASTGTISNITLRKNSSKKATLSFLRKVGQINYPSGFYCYMSGTSLKTALI